jgi:ATP-dependent Lon protease
MGGILLLETMLVPGGKGRLVLTGSLGDVIKESAELGLTWVKSRAMALGITSHRNQDPLKNVDIHVNVIDSLLTELMLSCTSLVERSRKMDHLPVQPSY